MCLWVRTMMRSPPFETARKEAYGEIGDKAQANRRSLPDMASADISAC